MVSSYYSIASKVDKLGDTMSGNLLFDVDATIGCTGSSLLVLKAGNTNRLRFRGSTTAGHATEAQINVQGAIFPAQQPTATAPTYVKGGIYFDTTLNKLRVGGATGWETITSD